MDKKIQLTINEEQANVIMKALDFYGRLEIGQINEISQSQLFFKKINSENRNEIEDTVDNLKKLLFPNLNGAFYSIYNKENVSDTARVGYDLIQVIRNIVAWTNNPEGGIQVCFDKPRQTSKIELANVKIIEEETEKSLS